MSEDFAAATRAVHAPDVRPFDQVPVGLPVYRTASFRFGSAQEYADLLNGRAEGFSYSRIANPTVTAFADAVAALERAEDAVAFSSGSAATSAILLSALSAGDHVVCAAGVYGGTWALLTRVLARFGVDTTFVPATDNQAVRAALTDRTKLVWVETMANPTLEVPDLPALADLAHAAGALLAVDSTFASPAICRPLRFGVDLVMHSATKFMSGHGDATGGVVCGSAATLAPVHHIHGELGAQLAPDEAFLLRRGLITLPLRVAHQSASALRLAEALGKHPNVDRVIYPGLADHPQHATATALFEPGLYGGIVTIDPVGGRAGGMAFCDHLRVGQNASSLGGAHTIVSHAASSTHRQLDDAALELAGITPATVRISVGLEDADDVIADCARALDEIGGH
jgi:cystathionine beta-lyase/cystathionine gamma-synthase